VRLLCKEMSPSAPQPAAAPAAIYTPEQTPPFLVRLGAWTFRQRSWLPVPLGLAVVTLRTGSVEGLWPIVTGVALILVGELLRLWAVRHIGTISRTRTSTRQGPLITSGPFRMVRNPLYLGNWMIWTGLVIASRLIWMLPFAWTVFALQYGTMVIWEESRLRSMFGRQYDRYALDVPRWVPGRPNELAPLPTRHPWRAVAFSERGTVMAIMVVASLLALKALIG
jgi:protein-S-isoprenylcysteine O-methyltransferase Ste14